MVSRVTEVDIGIFRQSKSTVYSLLDNQVHQTSVPINPNILTFKDKAIELEYTKELILEADKISHSEEFRGMLINYYIISSLMFIILISFIVLLYEANVYSYTEFIIHLIPSLLLFFINFIILFIIKRRRFYYSVKLIFTGFCLLLNSFFIICDSKILTTLIGSEYSPSSLSYQLLLLLNSYLIRTIIFDDFLHYFIISLHAVSLQFILNLGFSQLNIYTRLFESLVISLFLFYQLIEVHLNCLRSKIIFWRKYNEEQVDNANIDLEKSSPKEFQTETEHLMYICEKIKSDIKYAVKAIIFKDIKNRLKETLSHVQRIKKLVGHGIFENILVMENHIKDLEDREFIQQNYQEVCSTTDFHRSNTIVSFIEQKNPGPFHDYSLNELSSVLENIGKNWNFDIWFVHETTGKSISILAKYLFIKYNLSGRYKISDDVLERFLTALELGYRDCPYHNACHAADVSHTLMFFYINSDIYKFLNPIETLSSIIAANGHDIGHPGVNSRYLITTKDPLAVLYNDQSVLENMHCSTVYQILQKPGHNIFENLDSEEWTICRRIVLEMILSTDMAKHFEILGRFRTRAGILSDINLDKFEDRLLVYCTALKAADVGHSAKYGDLHQRWAKLVMEEYFKQGDLEKNRNFPISMYCDRTNTNIGKSQAGFLRNICLPLYEVWVKFLDSQAVNRVIEELKKNIEFWENVQKARRSTQPVSIDNIIPIDPQNSFGGSNAAY